MSSNSEVNPGPQMMISIISESAKIRLLKFSLIFMAIKRDFVENPELNKKIGTRCHSHYLYKLTAINMERKIEMS